MLRWKSSLKPAAAASGLQNPTLLGIRNPTSTSSSSTSINISSATQGALLLASVTARSTQGNLSAPTEGGWTLLASVDNGSSSARPLNRVYYKTAGASESTVTWTHDADYTSAVAIEIVGADTSTLAVTTNQSSDDLGVVTVPANGFVIAVHAKGASGDTSASTVRSSNGSTQTQYTALGDAYGTKRSGTFMAWGDVGAGDTNGTDYIEGAGSGSGSATHHIAIKPSGSTTYLLEENFEGTGTPTSWSSTGTVDYDSTPPASSPNGGEVMEITDRTNYSEFSTTGSNLYFQFRLGTLPFAANDWVGLLDGSGSILAGIVIQPDGGVRLQMDNTYSTMSDTISVNQWYHARLVYVSGGPSTLEINTTGTFSGDGTDYVEHTDSDATAAVATARIRGPRGGVRTGYYDRVISSSNTIGNNP
tara:strand:+ start:1148 stop:2404 length:1257 start_codon:yes stop_codon:yes gene_type:complete